MGFKTSKLTLLKLLLSASCAIYALLLVHTVSKRQLTSISDGKIFSFTSTRSRSTFAVFLLLQSLTESPSLGSGNFDVNRYFKLPTCDVTRRFHVYLLRYAGEPSSTAKESFLSYLNESFEQCQRHVPIVVDDFLIKDPTLDVRFLRDVILDAYLDNVDYYCIVLSGSITEAGTSGVDVSHWRDILLQRSPRGVGVVATVNPKERGSSVSKLFFSKVHMEIFGAALPFTNETLESALSYVVGFYSSYRMATIVRGREQILDNEVPEELKTSTHNWTAHLVQDSITLNRLNYVGRLFKL